MTKIDLKSLQNLAAHGNGGREEMTITVEMPSGVLREISLRVDGIHVLDKGQLPKNLRDLKAAVVDEATLDTYMDARANAPRQRLGPLELDETTFNITEMSSAQANQLLELIYSEADYSHEQIAEFGRQITGGYYRPSSTEPAEDFRPA